MIMVMGLTLFIVSPLFRETAAGLERRLEGLMGARQLLDFERHAQRAAERVLLPPWLQESPYALQENAHGVEVGYLDGAAARRLSVLRTGHRLEVRCDGELEAHLSGVRRLTAEAWTLPSGALIGVVLELEHRRLGSRTVCLRFGGAGGIL